MIKFLALGVILIGAALTFRPNITEDIFNLDDETPGGGDHTSQLLTDHVIETIREKFAYITRMTDRYVEVEQEEKENIKAELSEMVRQNNVKSLTDLVNKYYARIIGKLQEEPQND